MKFIVASSAVVGTIGVAAIGGPVWDARGCRWKGVILAAQEPMEDPAYAVSRLRGKLEEMDARS